MQPESNVRPLSWWERLFCILAVPIPFVGSGYAIAIESPRPSLVEAMPFFVIAAVYILRGINRQLFEWGLRVAALLYLFAFGWLIHFLIWGV